MSDLYKFGIPGSSEEITLRVKEGHTQGCRALANTHDGVWNTPWWHSSDMPSYWLASDGTHRGRHHMFLTFQCNSMDCQAQVIVEERGLAELVQAVIDGRFKHATR